MKGVINPRIKNAYAKIYLLVLGYNLFFSTGFFTLFYQINYEPESYSYPE